MSETITLEALRSLADAWLGEGKRVAGPTWAKPDYCVYAPVQSAAELVLDGYIHPRNSIKEFVFPRHEKIYGYKFEGQGVALEDVEPPDTPQVIVGARPCDAAALPILDHLFGWDYVDEFYTARRAATTLVVLACATHDEECFCTSVGCGPASETGADVLLFAIDGGFEVRCLTEKGQALFTGKTQSSQVVGQVGPGPERVFDPKELEAALTASYENPLWQQLTMRCLGCGACAYTCPTCHCFDIVDEGNARGGCRAKNWDCCQFGMFTHHASGHNPRSQQSQRQRQRIQHKFRIYPEKFGALLCTGCGNCGRNCPVGLGVLNVARELAKMAAETAK